MEAIHSAMVAHPASIFVELDDCSFSGAGTPMSSLTMMNHHLGVGFDPPEMVLDEVARRLFVCLLASLKTCASHVSDDFCCLPSDRNVSFHQV